MERPRTRFITALAAPALVSCAFVLDFDSLSSETDTPAQGGQLLSGGTGAAAGEGASAGSPEGGAAGGDGCPSRCFDDDPCTTDGCDEAGECRSETAVGLILDGIDQTVPADLHYRVTATAADDDFFLSAFSETSGSPTVTLYRLAAEGPEFRDIGSLTALTPGELGDPTSAAGLAFQPNSGLVHAFVATKKLGGEGSRVRHLLINASSLELIGAGGVVSESYWEGSPFNHPVAMALDGLPVVAWINEDQTIGLDGGPLEQSQTLSAETQATALSLFVTDDEQPGVLYGTAPGGVFVERPGIDPVAIDECQTGSGGYLSVATAFSSVPGYWLGAWTKLGLATDQEEGFLTTEGVGMYCGQGPCVLVPRDCSGTIQNNLARNPATAIVHRPGTPNGLVEVVQATPVLSPGEEPDTIVAGIALTQDSVDLGVPPFVNDAVRAPLGPPLSLSTQETSVASGLRGPDWPVIAHVPPDHYLVAWIEAAGEGDSLRVQRYRMCLP